MKCLECGRDKPLITGDLELIRDENAAYVLGARVALTFSETSILEALMINFGGLCPRELLMDLLYGSNDQEWPRSNSIDVIIGRIRRKIQGANVEIVAIRSRGFRLWSPSVPNTQTEEII